MKYYCTKCGAELNRQKGFSPRIDTWYCMECGAELGGDVFEDPFFPNVTWYCDGCGDVISDQPGFFDLCGRWKCKSCGYVNVIAEDEITYESDVLLDEETERACEEYVADWYSDSGNDYDSYDIENEEDDEEEDDDYDEDSYDDFGEDDDCDEYGYDDYGEGDSDRYGVEDEESDNDTNDGNLFEFVNYLVSQFASNASNIQEEKLKRKSFFARHWKGIFLFTFTVIMGIVAAAGYIEYQKMIPIGNSSEELIGKNYEQVVYDLNQAGFTNVKTKEIQDLRLENIDEENAVTCVRVGWKVSYGGEDCMPYNFPVEIFYHTLQKVDVSVSSHEFKKMKYYEVEECLRNAGFVNIEKVVDYDILFGLINKEGDVKYVSVDGKKIFGASLKIRPDVDIIISYHDLRKNRPKKKY